MKQYKYITKYVGDHRLWYKSYHTDGGRVYMYDNECKEWELTDHDSLESLVEWFGYTYITESHATLLLL